MRSIRQVDTETGEVLDAGVLVYVPQRPKLRESFVMTFQEGLTQLAKQGLTAQQWAVLATLIGKLDFENYIHLSQADVARELSMQRADVSRAFRRLLELGVLIKGPKVGRSATYQLSTHLGWKGRVRNLEQARRASLRVVKGKVDE